MTATTTTIGLFIHVGAWILLIEITNMIRGPKGTPKRNGMRRGQYQMGWFGEKGKVEILGILLQYTATSRGLVNDRVCY